MALAVVMSLVTILILIAIAVATTGIATLNQAGARNLSYQSVYAAEAMRVDDHKGRLTAGYDADFVVLTEGLDLTATYIGGTCVHSA